MRIYYVVGHREVDPSFRNNRIELDRFIGIGMKIHGTMP